MLFAYNSKRKATTNLLQRRTQHHHWFANALPRMQLERSSFSLKLFFQYFCWWAMLSIPKKLASLRQKKWSQLAYLCCCPLSTTAVRFPAIFLFASEKCTISSCAKKVVNIHEQARSLDCVVLVVCGTATLVIQNSATIHRPAQQLLKHLSFFVAILCYLNYSAYSNTSYAYILFSSNFFVYICHNSNINWLFSTCVYAACLWNLK